MIPYNAYESNQARIQYLQEGINRERLADSIRTDGTTFSPIVKLMRAVRHLIGDQPASETRSTGEITVLPAHT
ncbi:MAG: hypothetical protein GC204_01260 [Chloroflexi bacterium]|nr:hypothetical protein [Chloroflexota bacterium]